MVGMSLHQAGCREVNRALAPIVAVIHTQDADFTLIQADVLDGLRSLEDGSVHCVVTSPPYWGLRDYSTDGQLGLEATPDLYVARIVEVFREVWRVLRPDGTCWVNLGDSYAGSPGGSGGWDGNNKNRDGSARTSRTASERWQNDTPTLKPKDLVGMPWRVAFALQADGWYLRSDIVWSKPNPMPESVTDRPTKAHEYVFLLSKGARYFFDQEAVREPQHPDGRHKTLRDYGETNGAHDNHQGMNERERWSGTGRNVRSVWEIATQPYPEAHFATYPEELVRRCVLAGTSEWGCCGRCGKPWVRKTAAPASEAARQNYAGKGIVPIHRGGGDRPGGFYPEPPETLGWYPDCEHLAGPFPCTVLDPFLGSGTTAYVARKHGRCSIGIELNPAYCDLAARRMQQQSLLV